MPTNLNFWKKIKFVYFPAKIWIKTMKILRFQNFIVFFWIVKYKWFRILEHIFSNKILLYYSKNKICSFKINIFEWHFFKISLFKMKVIKNNLLKKILIFFKNQSQNSSYFKKNLTRKFLFKYKYSPYDKFKNELKIIIKNFKITKLFLNYSLKPVCQILKVIKLQKIFYKHFYLKKTWMTLEKLIFLNFLKFNIVQNVEKTIPKGFFLAFLIYILLTIFDKFVMDIFKIPSICSKNFFGQKIIQYKRNITFFFIRIAQTYKKSWIIKIENLMYMFIWNHLRIHIKKIHSAQRTPKNILLFNCWIYKFSGKTKFKRLSNFNQYVLKFKKWYLKYSNQFQVQYTSFKNIKKEAILNLTKLNSSFLLNTPIIAPLKNICKNLKTLEFLRNWNNKLMSNSIFLSLEIFDIIKIYNILIYKLLFYYNIALNIKNIQIICNHLYKHCILILAFKYNKKKSWILKKYSTFMKFKNKEKSIKLISNKYF